MVRGRLERLRCFYAEHGASVLFSAALSIVLEHLGLLGFLKKISVLLVAALASQGGSGSVAFAPGAPAVVTITESDFVNRYGERSPLDRCVLAGDIEKVLAKSPGRLAVDFDLSPVAKASNSERTCQARLDALLDRHARQLVLLVPFATQVEALLKERQDWMRNRCRAGASFADGTLDTSMGMTIEYLAGEHEALRGRMAEQLHAGGNDIVCRDAVADEASGKSWLRDQQAANEPEGEPLPINFSDAMRRLAVLPLMGPAFDGVASLAGSPVVLGGDWGRDDTFLTPIGPLPGAEIHGAKLVSLDHQVTSPALLGVASDVAIAMCFAWLVHGYWTRYAEARKRDLEHAGSPYAMGLATGWMFLFVLACGGLVLFFTLAAQYLFSEWAIGMAPLLIALSMIVDGFVSGPVDKIGEMLEEARHHGDAHLREQRPARGWPLAGVATIAGALLLAPAIGVALPSALAGWTFVAGFCMFYLASGLMLFLPGSVRLWTHWLRAEWRRLGHTIGAALCGRKGAPRIGAVVALARMLVFWSVLAWAVALLLHAWIVALLLHV